MNTGSRVELEGNQSGVVRYVGPARLGGVLEVWIGIELDAVITTRPQNAVTGLLGDGNVGNMRYFTCRPGRALFFRKPDLLVALELQKNHLDPELAPKAVLVQAVVRRHLAKKRVRALLASHAWNVLDTHLEELGLQRGAAVLRAQQQLQRQEVAASNLSQGSSEEEVVERVMRLAEREVAELTLETLQSIRVSKEYTGPHLRFPLTLDSVKSMMQDFKNNPDSVLHYRYLMSLFFQSKALFAAESNVQEISFPEPSPGQQQQGEDEEEMSLVVVGDIHGQLQDLFTIFALQGLPSHTNRFLFNGDFVDRGANGVEVLAVLCALKILFPQSVFLNRGNHEARAQNAWMGFEEELLTKYTSPHTTVKQDRRAALRVHLLCEQLFDALPLCAVVHRKVFVCHGGLFRNDGVTLNHLRHISRKREPPLNGRSFEDRVFEDLLWSDPRPTPHYPRALQGRRASDRGAGCEFGTQITAQFCKTNNIALVVRSHECVPEGFEVLHNGRLITIFSASRYCGTQTNKGAYIVLQRDLQPQVHQFYAQTQACLFITEQERQSALEADAIQMMVEQIVDHRVDLYWYFNKNDLGKTGLVSRVDWANALCNVIGLELPYLYYQRYIADATALGEINYSKFLSRFQIRGREEDSAWQDGIVSRVSERLFALFGPSLDRAWLTKFDCKQDGRVDSSSFAETLKSLDVGLNDMQLYELLHCLDVDGDAHVDFTEFSTRFGPHLHTLSRADDDRMEEDQAWKQGVIQHVANVLFQLRVHVRAAFRNFFDCDNFGRIPAHEFQQGLVAFNDTMQKPLTLMQIQELTRALTDAQGLISYQEFFDSLAIVDQHDNPTQQLVRKSSSFYFQQVDRNDKQDRLVMSKKAALKQLDEERQAKYSSSEGEEEEEVGGMDDF